MEIKLEIDCVSFYVLYQNNQNQNQEWKTLCLSTKSLTGGMVEPQKAHPTGEFVVVA